MAKRNSKSKKTQILNQTLPITENILILENHLKMPQRKSKEAALSSIISSKNENQPTDSQNNASRSNSSSISRRTRASSSSTTKTLNEYTENFETNVMIGKTMSSATNKAASQPRRNRHKFPLTSIENHDETSQNSIASSKSSVVSSSTSSTSSTKSYSNDPLYIQLPSFCNLLQQNKSEEKKSPVKITEKELSDSSTEINTKKSTTSINKNTKKVEEKILVPNWRITTKHKPSYRLEGTENLNDESFLQRHKKPENEEIRIKRNDMRLQREEYLRNRYLNGRSSSLNNNNNNNQANNTNKKPFKDLPKLDKKKFYLREFDPSQLEEIESIMVVDDKELESSIHVCKSPQAEKTEESTTTKSNTRNNRNTELTNNNNNRSSRRASAKRSKNTSSTNNNDQKPPPKEDKTPLDINSNQSQKTIINRKKRMNSSLPLPDGQIKPQKQCNTTSPNKKFNLNRSLDLNSSQTIKRSNDLNTTSPGNKMIIFNKNNNSYNDSTKNKQDTSIYDDLDLDYKDQHQEKQSLNHNQASNSKRKQSTTQISTRVLGSGSSFFESVSPTKKKRRTHL